MAKQVSELAVGTKVLGISGYGGSHERAGTVQEIVTDRWGTHAVVALDEGGTETLHGTLCGRAVEMAPYVDSEGESHAVYRRVEGVGIGWYEVEAKS